MSHHAKQPPDSRSVADPHLVSHTLHVVREEWQTLGSLFRFQWPLLLLLIVGIAALFYFAQPLPPTKIRVATGQPNSSLALLAKRYQKRFAEHGIELELVQTAGALENVELLRAGKVDVTFSLGGMVSQDNSNIVSLGSVEYQPFWIFYRGDEFDGKNPADFFNNRVLSINIPGSGTNSLSQKILALYGIRVEGNPRIVSLSSAQSIQALREGAIDGMLLVAGIDSGTIQRLLDMPGLRVLDLAHAETYRSTVKYLEPILLPRGGLDIQRDLPPQNKRLVAATTTLLTTNALHPSLQHLFLSTTKQFDQEGTAFFNRTGGFPAQVTQDLPLSKVAARYYEKGPPILHGYTRFWIATFFGEVGFIALALFSIGYPLSRLIPSYRKVYADLCIMGLYQELHIVDAQLRNAKTAQDFAQVWSQFDQIEAKATSLWVPSDASSKIYLLRMTVWSVRNEAKSYAAQLLTHPTTALSTT